MTNTINKIMHNGDEFKFDTSSVSGITTTQPSNPSEGAVYYDTTNDVVKVYDGTNWNVVGDDSADINTKTFYITGTTGTENIAAAQAAYDWYASGKNPILFFDTVGVTYGGAYILHSVTTAYLEFEKIKYISQSSGNTPTEISHYYILLEYSNGTVTSIFRNSYNQNFLSTDNTKSYTPTTNYHPATKKYVDDTVASAKSSGATAPSNPTEGQLWYDTTNDVLKVYDGTNWVEVGKEYNAGEGIEIKNGPDYSAMQGPAPTGYHVPQSSEWIALCGILTSTFGMDSNATTIGTYLKMPSAGLRSGSSSNVSDVGTYGRYWSSTAYSADFAYFLRFDSWSLSPQNGASRASGFSVRCFKDMPVIPDSSWNVLYQGTGSAGVFRNSSLGLISVSGDGTAWYTIQDKNLGATIVYNQGDTLSDANCGDFYQWGNNYGFPHSGTVTTSATQVDTSDYGPGNYYSSSTFITRISSPYDRSSVSNNNLWGGTTGVVTLNNAITNTGVLSVNGQTGNVVIPEGTNVKVFTISGEGDTTTGQQIYDYYKAGNTPFVQLNNAIYKLTAFGTDGTDSDLNFEGFYDYSYQDTTDSKMVGNRIVIFVTNDVVFDVVYAASTVQYLSTNANYQIPYTPQYNGSPATKKYVDDHDTVISGDSGTTYTIKVSNSAPASGTPNTTITFVTGS